MTKEKIEEAKAFSDAHLGPGLFNYAGEVSIGGGEGGGAPALLKDYS